MDSTVSGFLSETLSSKNVLVKTWTQDGSYIPLSAVDHSLSSHLIIKEAELSTGL